MQITISASDLARRLCGFTHASGSITLTIEDERIRSQILALLLPVPQSAEARDPPVSAPPASASLIPDCCDLLGVCHGPAICRAVAEYDDPKAGAPEPEPTIEILWQCGDILEGDRGRRPILVGYSERWVEVWPHDRAEDFAPRVWSEARAFESLGPFRRIGCVSPEVVLRARSGDEEAAAAIVRAAYPEGDED